MLSLIRSAVRSLPNTKPRPVAKRRTMLRVEALEARDVPSTFYVDTLADSHDTNPGDFSAQDSNV